MITAAPTRRPPREIAIHTTSRSPIPHEFSHGSCLGCAMRASWPGAALPCSRPRPAVERKARGAFVGVGRKGRAS